MNTFFLIVALLSAAVSPLSHQAQAHPVAAVAHVTPPPVGTFDSVLPHP